MRFVMMLSGLVLVTLAGLWFFTPLLDQTYTRHAPGLSHSRSATAARSTQSSPGGERAPAAKSGSVASASPILSKNIVDNVMSMINAGTGLLGLWFGWMSYRLQRRDSRRA